MQCLEAGTPKASTQGSQLVPHISSPLGLNAAGCELAWRREGLHASYSKLNISKGANSERGSRNGEVGR